MNQSIRRVTQAIEAVRSGQMVILVDDEDRENEGDLTMAAEKVTPEAINFMATYGRGLICLTLDEARIKQLELPMMVRRNEATLETAFTISIEARHGVTTGISAKDRATTVRTAIAPDARPSDLVSPGHIFPLRARPGGVLVRTGQTEGSVDLARLAGLEPAGVICEIMREDGEMARMPDLEAFAAKHGVMIVSIADLIAYRLQRERIVKVHAEGEMRPRCLGPGQPFRALSYGTTVENTEYLALVRGDIHAAAAAGRAVLVRVHSLQPIADAFGPRPEIEGALRMIDQAGEGVFLYVFNKARTSLERSFERVLGLANALEPRADASSGAHSEALRDFGLGAQVLADVGCHRVRLLSNTARRIAGIEGFGIETIERVPIEWPEERQPANLRTIEGGAATSPASGNPRDAHADKV
jgi:3,4-dihydroxy 2-butanone 4-phosphate synthase/GTP cyclohydrolase II